MANPDLDPSEEAFSRLVAGLEDDAGFDVEEFLAEHPAHESKLRERLEKLLRSGLLAPRESAESTLDLVRQRFEDPDGSHPCATGEASAGLLPSLVVNGRYRILAELGKGGMGRVFRALDIDLRREVALKIVDFTGIEGNVAELRDRYLERFVREARITSQLEHPSIVPLHDIGVDRSGQLYYTMKIIRGRTLQDLFTEWHAARARGAPVPLSELLRIVLQACEAVSLAHERGIIHRDLKPSNLMVGRHGEVHVLDWGLAKVVGAKEALPGPDASSTHASGSASAGGTIIGTPGYMAPEQTRGATDIDRRADVFGLGAILLHGLTGWPPPPHQSTGYPLHANGALLPVEIQAICDRALREKPEERYPSALELAGDLRAVLEHRVVQAYQTGALAELCKWFQRNRRAAGIGLAGLITLIAALVAGLLLWRRSEEQRLELLRLSASLEVHTLLEEADALWPVAPKTVSALEDWIRRARALTKELPVHRGLLAGIGEERDFQARWLSEQLTGLVESLDELEHGLLAEDATVPGRGWSIPMRLRFARGLESGFAPEGPYSRAWEDALPSIRRAYPDLDLETQHGLVPLGPDPASGLWEFEVLGTGNTPLRGQDGRLAVTPESCVVLVLLGGGTFTMGAQSYAPEGLNYDPSARSDEHPPHDVTLSPFFISKFEITQGQWLRLTGTNPSYYKGRGWIPGTYDIPESNPVQNLNWQEAAGACERLGLHLPTEAQWEYAARAGTSTPIWMGSDSSLLASTDNIADKALELGGGSLSFYESWDDGWAPPAPCGSYRPNPFGLHDVYGNATEWCQDYYEPLYYYQSDETDPLNAASSTNVRVLRGGSFAAESSGARSAARFGNVPGSSVGTAGLRPARAVASAAAAKRVTSHELPHYSCNTFYLWPGRDPIGSKQFVKEIGESARIVDFEDLPNGGPVDRLCLGHTTIDVDLVDQAGNALASSATAFVDTPYSIPGVLHNKVLLNRAPDGTIANLEFHFDPPIRAFGSWIYDDFNSQEVHYGHLDEHDDPFAFIVTCSDGTVHSQKPVHIRAGPATEGFFGFEPCTGGIRRVRIVSTPGEFVEVDNVVVVEQL